MSSFLTVTMLVVVLVSTCCAIDNGLALRPAMGWNSWTSYRCKIDENTIAATAKAMVSSKLSSVGYTYVNMDDCWGTRQRDSNGRPVANATRFPNGMKALTDYIHSVGLKAGIYSDAGTFTCFGDTVGTLGHEYIDAATFADWGFDYLKHDDCNAQHLSYGPRFSDMSAAILATKRPVLYSICTARTGLFQPYWARRISNSWRTTTDINSAWTSIMHNLDGNNEWWQMAGPGGFNDPDMLQVGNGQLTDDEQVSHFSLWCAIKAPLIIGTPLTTITERAIQILSNTELIAINQDRLARQAHLTSNNSANTLQVYSGPLNNGSIVAILFNRGNVSSDMTLLWSDIGLPFGANATVRDLWEHADVGVYDRQFTATNVRPHATVSLTITVHPPSQCCLPSSNYQFPT